MMPAGASYSVEPPRKGMIALKWLGIYFKYSTVLHGAGTTLLSVVMTMAVPLSSTGFLGVRVIRLDSLLSGRFWQLIHENISVRI